MKSKTIRKQNPKYAHIAEKINIAINEMKQELNENIVFFLDIISFFLVVVAHSTLGVDKVLTQLPTSEHTLEPFPWLLVIRWRMGGICGEMGK